MTDVDHSNFWPDHVAAQQQDDDRILETVEEFRCDCRISRWNKTLVFCSVMSVVIMLATIGACIP
ncbi:hypothetical protein GS854_01680 [Rhodococcus hoagii]|nr:hypothetical protein [Prescottella equi]NKT91779.1 hypothetical protein [Prescottella equi]